MRGSWKIFVSISACTVSAAAPAQHDAAGHWRALTAADVEAAYRMIAEDHPGAATEVADLKFQRLLADGYAEAKKRAGQTTSYDGYIATLAGFAASLGDKHIWSRPLYMPEARDWAGIVVARRGHDFVVADEQEAVEGAPLKGAKLVSCDGVSADKLADERLGEFKIVRGIEAQLIQRAFWLLLDEGNPFLKRPQSCQFEQEGQTRPVALKWRQIQRTDLGTKLAAVPTRGAAGFGVRKVGDGYWIAVQSFNDKAVPVVEEVRAKAAEIRQAPYVVLDVRGNGGGNSALGSQIAETLLGSQPAAVSEPSSSAQTCSKVWRLSDRNLKQVEYQKNELGPKQGKQVAESMARQYDTVSAAKAAGLHFSGKVKCGETALPKAAAKATQRSFPKRVILLTDNACFSSCLLVTDEFRRLGALHVGQTTDANTHYMEVREDKLPSGLSVFSTLQALAPAAPAYIGPFEPSILYDGNIADTAAVEKWVASVAVGGSKSAASAKAGSS
jgi:hypothetical protein